MYDNEKSKKKKTPKTREVFVLKANYGQGYEDEVQETSYLGAKNRLYEYRTNAPEYSYKLVNRRVPYFELSENDKKSNTKELDVYLKRTTKKKGD